MVDVPATEFARNFGRYRELAQRQPIAVRAHDRVTGYFVSADAFAEYQALKARAAVALAVEELDAITLHALEWAEMDPRHAHLDALLD
jgi:hypothetical protein